MSHKDILKQCTDKNGVVYLAGYKALREIHNVRIPMRSINKKTSTTDRERAAKRNRPSTFGGK